MNMVNRNLYSFLLNLFPIILLFFLVLVDFDFSFHSKKLVTFNLAYIVIYYWVLKKPEILGYGLVFFAGIINDVVIFIPLVQQIFQIIVKHLFTKKL